MICDPRDILPYGPYKVCGHPRDVCCSCIATYIVPEYPIQEGATMQIKRTKDRVILSAADIQTLLKKHIKEQTGREVHGDVLFEKENGPMNRLTANCELVDGPVHPVQEIERATA